MTEGINIIKCRYCSKERPADEMEQGTIITRGRKWDAYKHRDVACIVKETNWYCKGTSCKVNDQMGHEG